MLTITKIDSKGRISIPAHLRSSMGIKGGDALALVTNGRKEITVLPEQGRVVTVKVVMKSLQKMKRLIDVFNSHRMTLLSMESLTLERDEKFECTATLELNGCDLESLRKEIRHEVEDVEISSYSF